jgi:pimeloyl-ACP methyl ester carboxylesterase
MDDRHDLDHPDLDHHDLLHPERPHPHGLHEHDSEDGAADPPIILVPGIDGTALLFYRQQPLLARRFDVIAFPLPSIDPHVMTMPTLVRDLAQLIGELSDRGAILLGESFGGALAMSTALAHPDLVHGLVIVNSFPYLDQRVKLAAAPLALKALPWAAMPLVRKYTSRHLHSPHTDEADIAEFLRCAREIDRDSYIRRLEILQQYDLRDRLHEIEVPTMFVAGDHDRLLPSVRWASYMHERVRNSRVHVLQGYGHVCLIDHDLDISELVVPWWDEVAGSP